MRIATETTAWDCHEEGPPLVTRSVVFMNRAPRRPPSHVAPGLDLSRKKLDVFDPGRFPPEAGSLLPGLLTATRAGLAPAGDDELMLDQLLNKHLQLLGTLRFGRLAAAPGSTRLAAALSPIASALLAALLALLPWDQNTRQGPAPAAKRPVTAAGDYYDRRRGVSPAFHQSGSSPSSRSHSSVRAARSHPPPVWPQNFQSSRAERL